jgi:signal transduction histidine kinase
MDISPSLEESQSRHPAIVVTNPAGVIGNVSARALALLNAPEAFVLGKPIFLFFAREAQRGVLDSILRRRRVEDGGAEAFTAHLLPYRAPPVLTRVTLYPVRDRSKTTIALHWSLEQVAVEPGAQAPRADPTAASLETLRRTILSAVSHEMLTPLAVIQGQAETLRDPRARDDPARLESGLVAIEEQSLRLRRLVQNLLDAARATAGPLPVTLVPLDPLPVIVRAVSLFGTRSRRHTFLSDLPAALPAVLADRERLDSVLYNLLDNALKYSPRGGRIVVRAVAGDDDVELSVADEGGGIAPADRAHVFEPYFRAEAQAHSPVPGHGLGLYLCRTIVEAHGGRIWIDGGPERGATFRFTLPRGEPVRRATPPRPLEYTRT